MNSRNKKNCASPTIIRICFLYNTVRRKCKQRDTSIYGIRTIQPISRESQRKSWFNENKWPNLNYMQVYAHKIHCYENKFKHGKYLLVFVRAVMHLAISIVYLYWRLAFCVYDVCYLETNWFLWQSFVSVLSKHENCGLSIFIRDCFHPNFEWLA